MASTTISSPPSSLPLPNPQAGYQMNGVSPEYEHAQYDDSTPQPHMAHQSYPSSAFLPQMTTSPPPQAPSYVPPPQYATAPDPIHGMMPGQSLVSPSTMGFPSGPYPGYRSGPSVYGPGYRLPNGHTPPTPGPDGYHQTRPTQSMGPGSSGQALMQHPMMMNGTRGRPGSAGESRERRQRERSHQGEEDGDRDMREDEVISTIFVVGFPDDMLEREFQNIFTFASGFEAATLKFPSGSSSRTREPTATLLAELTQIAAAQQAAAQQAAASGEHVDFPLQSNLEEAIAALQLSGTTSTSTTPSAAISLTPSAQSGPFGQALPQLPTRRQTIGFARFKTRADALAAREQLQGKKIDPLSGATLKAEMAKKNLHMKKNSPNEELVGMLLRSGRLARLVSPSGQNQPGHPRMAGGQGAGPVPAGYPGDWEWQEGYPPTYPFAPPNAPNAYSGASSTTSQAQPAPQTLQNSVAPTSSDPSSLSNSSDSPPHSITSPKRASDSKALLALAEEADELEGWGAIGAMSMTMEGVGRASDAGSAARRERERSSTTTAGTFTQSAGSNPLLSPSVSATPVTTTPNVAQINQSSTPSNTTTHTSTATSSLPATLPSAGMYRNNYHPATASHPSLPANIPVGPGAMSPRSIDGFAGSPPSVAGDHLDSGRVGIGAGPNPADQNPPINTLYVGNLPAISPPTHPPNFLEESLRGLFSRCGGYKRMSFRQKINGPMCFVEFEDVACASQAIKELYGHNLGGLVKGGIRLSYSKNSLGQRGNAHPAGINTSLFGGIAHTVALAGMSSPSNGSNGHNANYPGTGLQLSNSGGPGGPQSAPIPMPNDLRRGSEHSGLSPNAQPFNASLPIATSPRSRYFGSSPGNPLPPISISTGPASGSGSTQAAGQGQNGQGQAQNQGPTAQPIPQPPQANSAQFSPVSSPIRTPASYSWVSSGSTSTAGVGNGGYGFEPFSHGSGVGMSLSGAASAWQQGQYGRGQ